MEKLPADSDISESPISALRESYQKLTKAFAFLALLSTASVEAKTPVRSEYSDKEKEKVEQVENICHKHGFSFVDEKNIQVNLPPGEVKKVIFHIGWVHKVVSYDDESSRNRRRIVNSAEDVYTMFYSAAEQTGRRATCLLEGATDKEDLGIFGGIKNLEQQEEWLTGVIKDERVSIPNMIAGEVEQVKKFFNNDEGLVSYTLYKFAVAARHIAASSNISNMERERALECATGYEKNFDHQRIMYTLGGIGAAADAGLVDVRPSESEDMNRMVAIKALEAVGIKYNPNIDFYKTLREANENDAAIMKEKIHEYGLSPERERPVIKHAADALKREEFVTVLFGNSHDFSDIVEEMRVQGKLNDTALVKFDTLQNDVESQ